MVAWLMKSENKVKSSRLIAKQKKSHGNNNEIKTFFIIDNHYQNWFDDGAILVIAIDIFQAKKGFFI